MLVLLLTTLVAAAGVVTGIELAFGARVASPFGAFLIGLGLGVDVCFLISLREAAKRDEAATG